MCRLPLLLRNNVLFYVVYTVREQERGGGTLGRRINPEARNAEGFIRLTRQRIITHYPDKNQTWLRVKLDSIICKAEVLKTKCEADFVSLCFVAYTAVRVLLLLYYFEYFMYDVALNLGNGDFTIIGRSTLEYSDIT